MGHTALYGDFEDRSRYDLLEAVMIRLGKPGDGSELHKMLNVLLSTEISPEDKEKTLAADFHIESAESMKEEFHTMCNLSIGIEEKGKAKGEDKLASLLRILTPGSEDFNMAISENPEDREIVFKKYVMAE